MLVYLPASLVEIERNTQRLYSGNLVDAFFPLIENRAGWYCNNSVIGQKPKMAYSYITQALRRAPSCLDPPRLTKIERPI